MNVLSSRNITDWPSNHLIFEWEDYIAKALDCQVVTANRYIARLSMGKAQKILPFLLDYGQPKGLLFKFEAGVLVNRLRRDNTSNVIPCIVDYFLCDNQLDVFEKQFCNNPVVLVSSMEVFERLRNLETKVKLVHCPLTLPDKYRINGDEKFDRQYDCVLLGRQNNVLLNFMNQYAVNHPDFTFVREGDKKFQYYTSKGDYLGTFASRDSYFQLMKKSRVLLYSTPGIDGGEQRTNGFNQVTPKFLEGLACGCHIIARWKDNPDTDWYRLSNFSENINNYPQFEKAMDVARKTAPDIRKYAEYLEHHYTSTIIPIIKELI